jgi:arginase family enzyme
MKIQLQNPTFYPALGGIENYLYYTAKTLLKIGHEPEILCSRHIKQLPAEEEYEKIKSGKYNIFYAKDVHDNKTWFNQAIEKLTENVYITFDIDAFDPSLIPGTGTPEPGGLTWYLVCDFLKEVFFNRNVIGVDIVEVAPQENSSVSEFVASKLLYKMMTYKYIKMNNI